MLAREAGLSTEEFWEYTPCEVSAFVDRHLENVRNRYVLPVIQFAQFASCYFNSRAGEAVTTPDTFIPKFSSAPAQPPDPKKIADQRLAMWKSYAEHTGQKFEVKPRTQA